MSIMMEQCGKQTFLLQLKIGFPLYICTTNAQLSG